VLKRAAPPLTRPMGLAVAPSGSLYIADSGAYRVHVSSDGALSDVAGPVFDTPVAVAADASGAVYVADFYGHLVYKVAAGVATILGGTGEYGVGAENVPATSTPLAGPSGIALDSAGSLYIAEAYNNRIRRVANGVIITVAATGTNLRQPSDVAVDASGNL